MKRYLALIIIAVMLVQSACLLEKQEAKQAESGNPEPAPASATEAAVTASVQETKLPGESSSYEDPLGFQAGVIYRVMRLRKQLDVMSELNVSMQGAKYTDEYDGYSFHGRVVLWYANLPLTIRYQVKNGLFAEAGIQPGFLLSARDKYENNNDNFRDQVNFFDFGIPVGLGYRFNDHLSVGLRMIEGISNINKAGSDKDRNFVLALRGIYKLKK